MRIIGLTGYKQCGKSSAAQVLTEGFGFVPYAFADGVRAMAAAIDPAISLDDAPDDVWEQSPAHPGLIRGLPRWRRYTEILRRIGYERGKQIPDFRRFLQRLGTEGVRGTFGPQAWVEALARRLAEDDPAGVVIADVRFESEEAWVHAQGGEVWRMERPGVGGDDPHPSEAGIPHLRVDQVVRVATLAELHARVQSLAHLAGF